MLENNNNQLNYTNFTEDIWFINYSRTKVANTIVFLFMLFSIVINLIFKILPVILLLHIIVSFLSLLYLSIAWIGEKYHFDHSLKWRMIYVLSYCFFIIIVFGIGIIVFTNATEIYIIPVFATGAFILLKPIIAFTFFITTHILFISLLFIFVSEVPLVWETFFNTSIAIVLVLAVTIFSYKLRRQDFNYQKTIKDRTKELKKLNSFLEKMASSDELTGLPNRRSFMDSLKQEILRAQRYKHTFSIMIIDIDDFKKVNDCYGHAAGDKSLKHFAAVLKNNLRKTDIPGRLGGEEFGVILPDTILEDGYILAERLRKEIEKSVVSYNDKEIFFTISIGISSYQYQKKISGEELFNKADKALYQAKKKGKNLVVAI